MPQSWAAVDTDLTYDLLERYTHYFYQHLLYFPQFTLAKQDPAIPPFLSACAPMHVLHI